MAAGVKAAVMVPGVKFISPGNFGGTLGPYKIEFTRFCKISFFISVGTSIHIYSVITDYFVNENFGDNMIRLTPDDAKKRFGLLFSLKFLVMVDERSGRAEIIETCRARGTIEWDAMNRRRAGGAVTGVLWKEQRW